MKKLLHTPPAAKKITKIWPTSPVGARETRRKPPPFGSMRDPPIGKSRSGPRGPRAGLGASDRSDRGGEAAKLRADGLEKEATNRHRFRRVFGDASDGYLPGFFSNNYIRGLANSIRDHEQMDATLRNPTWQSSLCNLRLVGATATIEDWDLWQRISDCPIQLRQSEQPSFWCFQFAVEPEIKEIVFHGICFWQPILSSF